MKKLSDAQKRSIKVLANHTDKYIDYWQYYDENAGHMRRATWDILKQLGLIEQGIDKNGNRMGYRLTEAGKQVAIELGYITEQPNVMDKNAGDVHEETPEDEQLTSREIKFLKLLTTGEYARCYSSEGYTSGLYEIHSTNDHFGNFLVERLEKRGYIYIEKDDDNECYKAQLTDKLSVKEIMAMRTKSEEPAPTGFTQEQIDGIKQALIQAEDRQTEADFADVMKRLATRGDEVRGLMHLITSYFEWDTIRTHQLAHDMLEDVNLHDEAAALAAFDSDYESDEA